LESPDAVIIGRLGDKSLFTVTLIGSEIGLRHPSVEIAFTVKMPLDFILLNVFLLPSDHTKSIPLIS
jgi:hypothetical protein